MRTLFPEVFSVYRMVWLKGFIKGVRGACVALYLVEKLHYAVLSASTNGG